GGAEHERLLTRALDDLVGAIWLDGHRVVLALAPTRLQVYPHELETTIERSAPRAADYDPHAPRPWLTAHPRSRGLAVRDTADPLRAAATSGERLYLVNDTHWNIRGNHVAGEELARGLIAAGALPPGRN